MTLLEIQKLCEGASEGPWVADGTLVRTPCYKSPSGYDAFEIDSCDGRGGPTASFIASSRTLMPLLLRVAVAAAEYRDGVYDFNLDRVWVALAALEGL